MIRADASRFSRESPVPVFDLRGHEAAEGGMGNVMRQLRLWGIQVRPVVLARRPTIRLVAGCPEQQVARLDGRWQLLSRAAVDAELSRIRRIAPSAAVYVDYRGRSGPEAAVRRFLEGLSCPAIADARRSLLGWDKSAILKMSEPDARTEGGEQAPGAERGFRSHLADLRYQAGLPTLVLTRNCRGHAVITEKAVRVSPAVSLAGPILNVSGAGDVFTAVLAAVLASRHEAGAGITACDTEQACATAARAAALRGRKPGYNEAVTWREMTETFP